MFTVYNLHTWKRSLKSGDGDKLCTVAEASFDAYPKNNKS